MDIATILGAGIVSIIIAFFVYLLVMAFFLWIGAHIARVSKSTFGRSLLCAFLITVISWFVAGLLSFTGIAGTWVGFVIALLITLFIIKGVYRTGFGRAILVWIFSILAVIVVAVIFVLILVPVLGISGYNYM
jgi:hypothetical protein